MAARFLVPALAARRAAITSAMAPTGTRETTTHGRCSLTDLYAKVHLRTGVLPDGMGGPAHGSVEQAGPRVSDAMVERKISPAGQIVVALGVAVALCPAAQASDAVADVKADAMRLAAEGAAAYKAGQYPEALAKFETAYHEYPVAPLVLDLSHVEVKLGHCDKAIGYARTYGAAFGPESRSSLETPEGLLLTVQTECPEAEVTSDPTGAMFRIEGLAQAAPLVTPWKGRLPVGKHLLLARHEGFPFQRGSITVEPGKAMELHLTFGATPAVTASAPEHASAPPVEDLPFPGDISPSPALPPPPSNAAAPAEESLATPSVALLPPVTPPRASATTEVPITSPPPGHRAVHAPPWAAGWSAIGVGALALVVGVGLGIASHTQQTAVHTTLDRNAGNDLNTGNTEAIAADVLFATGGVLGAAGTGLVVAF